MPSHFGTTIQSLLSDWDLPLGLLLGLNISVFVLRGDIEAVVVVNHDAY